ncbi:siroheme synthase CysG [Rhodobium gokarnense]|uniref:Siroheme synthase n=1 Tax=Rhodobium gokarnense TaxID=364296 RepID=A0ABT3H7C8_9HYPH|nr:siroheme synthase CysG [Rhodobium gokarnense]MCW2306298.1 uroporphyrin-III C-methyltransferase/precorrin-2 dehydrogenase/sirohydrochlorin ferrochelatase [Rhodobium gokarnense]
MPRRMRSFDGSMEQLPIFLDIRDKRVIVVGGGTAAARKADHALRAGARVTVLADSVNDDFKEWADHPNLTVLAETPRSEHFAGAILAYGAAEDREIDLAVHKLAREAGTLVNIVDSPDYCDFVTPAVVDRDPLLIAISSSGTSPILARIIKARLETMLPSAYGRLARFVGELRGRVMEAITDGPARRRFWERIIDGPVADLVLSGSTEKAEATLNSELEAARREAARPTVGEVYLVGAGPGDPDLLTFRALRLIQRADVVLYDRLISDCLLNLVRRDAERIYVGKMNRDHTMPQEDISELMVRLAQEGKRVLRLKGGDPFIFGRGGEEIERLALSEIPFQVVPGITAATGASAYAGIPLTHRDHAQACVFVTGHGKNGRLDLDWKTLLQPAQTVVVYMGLSMLPELTREFLARGADPDLPVAVVENATRRSQRVVTGTVTDIADKVAEAGIEAPALTILGTVVTLRARLNWYHPSSAASDEGDCLHAMPFDPVETSEFA